LCHLEIHHVDAERPQNEEFYELEYMRVDIERDQTVCVDVVQ